MSSKKKTKKSSKVPQDKISSGDQSPGPINGLPNKKQSDAAHLNEPKFQESFNENSPYDEKETQNTDPKNGKKQKNKKGSTSKKRKKPKKTGFFGGLFTFRSFLILYVLGVFFVCHGKTRKQCSYPVELFCYNGVSQYILTHDWFQKYIEPGVLEIKGYSADYGNQAFSTYEIHAKPRLNPYVESAQPYIQKAKELSIEYVYNPATQVAIKVQEFYNQNAKDSVDAFYGKARKTVTPYLNKAQKQINHAYEKLIIYNKKHIQPWLNNKVIPFVVESKKNIIVQYNEKVAPVVDQLVKTAHDNYNKHIVPFYNTNIKPHVEYCFEVIVELVQGKDESRKKTDLKAKKEAERKAREQKAKEEAELKAKEEAKRKAKEEAERKAKEEAERKAKKEAERKAKEEAERKAKEEAERKAKEEAERKAKEEAERKAKEEAERKAKEEAERKAKEEAERKVKEEAERKAKEEAERKAKEEAERKAKEEAERKAKEEAEKAAIAAAIKAVRDTAAIGISRARENISIVLKDYELKAKSAVKKTSDDTEAKIISLKKLGTDYPSKLTKFVDELAKDAEKNITVKIDKISEYAKETIDTVKTNIKKADESFEALNEKVNELEKDFVLVMNSNMNGIKTNAHSKAGKITIDQKIYDEVDRDINTASQSMNAEFSSSTLRVKEEIKGVETKVTSLKSTARSVVQDIVNSTKIATQILKQRDTPVISQNDSSKGSDKVPQFVVQTSNDPVLDKLKAQYRLRDPVLQKLKDEYQKTNKNKQSGKIAKDGSY
ncbi:10926_t:CDS:2 [Racocetra persica]|uniref:10926_t:CDS:1 n=1 Tax=Racocetra persica TaxID=160502 RepID=A0ACA9NCN3_9GLOM|nr:10926_t:CDS:2 [Racocetra persica]